MLAYPTRSVGLDGERQRGELSLLPLCECGCMLVGSRLGDGGWSPFPKGLVPVRLGLKPERVFSQHQCGLEVAMR